MSEDYKSYTFTLGSSPGRVYQGQRMSPREGIELGADLADLIAQGWSACMSEEVNSAKRREIKLSDDEDRNRLYDIITMFSYCYNSLDKKKYFSLFDYIMDKTVVLVKKETDKNVTNLRVNTKPFDDWFSEFPQDLAFFTAAVLVENAAPFLPEIWKKRLGGELSVRTLQKLFQ